MRTAWLTAATTAPKPTRLATLKIGSTEALAPASMVARRVGRRRKLSTTSPVTLPARESWALAGITAGAWCVESMNSNPASSAAVTSASHTGKCLLWNVTVSRRPGFSTRQHSRKAARSKVR